MRSWVRWLVVGLTLITMLATARPIAAQPSDSGSGSDAASNPPGIPADAVAATVIEHRDGRTLVVRLDGKRKAVVLIGVDAPDPNAGPAGECFAQESLERLRKVVPVDSVVYLEADAVDEDDKNRLLRYVWLPAAEEGKKPTLVNQKMIRDGFAAYLDDEENDRYAERLQTAEQRAQDELRGLWAECGGPHERLLPTPTPTLSADQLLSQYQPLADVRDLAIRPWTMYGQKIVFSGTILSIHVASPGEYFPLGDSDPQPFNSAIQVTVVAPDGSTEVVFVGYNGDTSGMYEDSYVTVYGVPIDTQSFTNTLGGGVTQPLVAADLVELG